MSSEKSMVDPLTRQMTKMRLADKKVLSLVMSDEFSQEGRSFKPGEDKFFEAVEKPDDTNDSIEFYNSSTEYVATRDDCLIISTKAVKSSWTEWHGDKFRPMTYTKNYTSGMVQSWNKFCFTGGILEMSIDLPGKSDSGGLWPAVWLMGNLARAGYSKSTLYVWPWSYDRCGEIDNLSSKQKISACQSDPGFGFLPNQGRGAPEIDIFEVMPGHEMPGFSKPLDAFMSSSLQISPGVAKGSRRPRNGERLNASQVWYDMKMGPRGDYNYWFWGQECGPEIDYTEGKIHKYLEDAISVNSLLNETHFDSQHIYKLEWQPGREGYLHWYLDDELILSIEGSSLEAVTGSQIPAEPMYVVMNTAISHRWGMPEPCPINSCPVCWHCYDCTNPDCQCALPNGMKNCKNLPAEMKIDYIRIYQDKDDPSHTLGCSPPGFPTAEYINAHRELFSDWQPMNPTAIAIYHLTSYLAEILSCLGLFIFVLWSLCKDRFRAMRSGYRMVPDRDTTQGSANL